MQGACLRPLIPNGIKNFGQKGFHFPILRNGWKQRALFPNALSQFEGRIVKGFKSEMGNAVIKENVQAGSERCALQGLWCCCMGYMENEKIR